MTHDNIQDYIIPTPGLEIVHTILPYHDLRVGVEGLSEIVVVCTMIL